MENKCTMPRVRSYGNFEGCYFRSDISREEFEAIRRSEEDRYESVYKIEFNRADLIYTLIEEDSKKGIRITKIKVDANKNGYTYKILEEEILKEGLIEQSTLQ